MIKKEEVLEYLRKHPQALQDEYVIKRKASTKKQTFEVEEDLLKRFYAEAGNKGLKIKEAIDQALRAWLGK